MASDSAATAQTVDAAGVEPGVAVGRGGRAVGCSGDRVAAELGRQMWTGDRLDGKQ